MCVDFVIRISVKPKVIFPLKKVLKLVCWYGYNVSCSSLSGAQLCTQAYKVFSTEHERGSTCADHYLIDLILKHSHHLRMRCCLRRHKNRAAHRTVCEDISSAALMSKITSSGVSINKNVTQTWEHFQLKAVTHQVDCRVIV